MHDPSRRIDVPDPHPPKEFPSIAPRYRYVVLLVSIFLVLSANGSMFVLVVGLKQIALDFGWPRSVPSFAYSCLFLGTGVGGIVMGYWFDRSGAGPVTGTRHGDDWNGRPARQHGQRGMAALPRSTG